jgi:hypothetical protein
VEDSPPLGSLQGNRLGGAPREVASGNGLDRVRLVGRSIEVVRQPEVSTRERGSAVSLHVTSELSKNFGPKRHMTRVSPPSHSRWACAKP